MSESAIPKPPPDLAEAGSRLWLAVTERYVLERHHFEILRAGCEAADRAAACRRQIDDEGETVLDRFQQQKAHPLLGPERDARLGMLRALQQLGIDRETAKFGRPTVGR